MRGQSQDELGYKILLIRLAPSCDWSYDFIISQLLFLLDASFNKYVVFEIIALLIGKNFLNPGEN